jgi:hypothetical protein
MRQGGQKKQSGPWFFSEGCWVAQDQVSTCMVSTLRPPPPGASLSTVLVVETDDRIAKMGREPSRCQVRPIINACSRHRDHGKARRPPS